MLHRLANQSHLLDMQIGQIGRLETPLDFGIAAERACAGTRRVDQNSIEFDAERQRLRGIEHDKRAVEIAHLLQAVQVDVARDGTHSLLNGLRGFVAGRGADIEKSLAGMQIKQWNDGLSADILDAPRARDVGLGRLEERGSDLIRGFAAELAIPFFEQPARCGQGSFPIGPRHGLAIGFAQNRVHQSGGGRFVRALHQFDAFADGGMRRDAIEIAQLVDAHAQSDADFGLRRARDTASDQIVELGLVAEASEDDFRGEAGVARIELRRALQKKIGSIAPLLDFAEDVESDLARW